MSLQVDQELLDRSDKQPDAAKMAHVRFDMNGVHTLLAQIGLENLGQCLQGSIEHLGVALVRGQVIPHGPERFVADVRGGVSKVGMLRA